MSANSGKDSGSFLGSAFALRSHAYEHGLPSAWPVCGTVVWIFLKTCKPMRFGHHGREMCPGVCQSAGQKQQRRALQLLFLVAIVIVLWRCSAL
mmetsp:Transcript_55515/g.153671  ORF Transcript_55515/g.153671 Transcript_55515/m.153671 type:complete len:94 (+) Transcript_55515:177-458(+)